MNSIPQKNKAKARLRQAPRKENATGGQSQVWESKRHNEKKLTSNDQLFLYITVSVTGAAIMMIELLGTRIIGPFYGVSLYVWSSLISVTLIALAMGYYLGGILADKHPKFRLSHAILIASLSIAVAPMISTPIMEISNALGVRGGAFTSALVLFTIPLMCLAMAGPYVIKLSASGIDGIGTASGSVYAISTVGSVVGTLLLGFYLLPLIGSRSIVYVVSIALFLLAACLSFYEIRRFRISSIFAWTFFLGIVLSNSLMATPKSPASKNTGFKLLCESESLYGRIRVIDDLRDNIRWMLSDSSTISGIDLESGKNLLAYQSVVDKLPYFRPQAKDALIIGLGGGQLVTEFSRHHLRTDVMEIDPAVAAAARRHFDFTAPGALIIGDARYQVRRLSKKYDFIVHDCFAGGSEPVHLLSVEMLKTLRDNLKNGGILALNYVGFVTGSESEVVKAVYRTLVEFFPHRLAFTADPAARFNDFIFFASDKPMPMDSPTTSYRMLQWAERHRYKMPKDDGFIISDDYNPLESLQVGKAEAYRELLVKRIGPEALMW